MSIRNITVQYVGDVLFLPKLERDVKLVVERDYGTADPDKRFVMEQSENNRESRWFELFGTPERAARTMKAASDACKTTQPCYPNCPLGAAPWCHIKNRFSDYDTLLEWLRGGSE